MKKYFIGLSLFFLTTTVTPYAKTIIEEANSAYTIGNFCKAVQLYKKAITENGESSSIYYNLGNAYYRLNQIAYAILYYERSILINPYNKEAKFNLAIAKQKTIDKIKPTDSPSIFQWIQLIRDKYSIEEWGIIGIVCFLLFAICLSIFYFFHKKISFYIGWIFFIFCILSNVSAYNQKENLLHRQTAIIITHSASVKSSPDHNGKKIFILHAGSKVKITETLGHWINIETLNGYIGWIEKNKIQII